MQHNEEENKILQTIIVYSCIFFTDSSLLLNVITLSKK